MQFIDMPMGTGKTEKLIRMAANWNGYIVALHRGEAKRIADRAEKLGIDINFPITHDEFRRGQFSSNRLFIDNVEMLLQSMAKGAEVVAVTHS